MANLFIGHTSTAVGAVGDIDTTQRNALGSRVQTDDGGEYVYLKGVASLLKDDAVNYNASTFIAVRLATHAVGLVAVAPAAILAANFGWFMIRGFTTVNSDTVAAAGGLFIDGTTGRVDDMSVAGDFVNGMVSTGPDVVNKLPVHLSYPYVTNTVPA